MPFYEYECQACKYYAEVMQKISDPPLTRCPSCGKRALKKLLSVPVFRLKGGGWYETDFETAKTVGPTSRSRAAKARSAGSRRPSRPTRGRSTRKKRR